ncbi:MAG: DUF3298 and DUF4163 domain-containing protein [Sphingomonadales bacterium]|nr:DUF3298 and DUF4163 domain-containing protein [Sphingomonadales bacterium]
MPALLIPLLLLSACGKQEDQAQPAKPDARATAQALATSQATPPAGSASASAEAGGARKVSVSNAFYEYDYAYPAAVGAIPALKAQLDAEAATSQHELDQQSREASKDAKGDGYPFNPWSSGTDWQVVTDLPGWLSLSAQVYSYEGGAHPNHGYSALLWDKHANQRRSVIDLFTSKAALTKVLSEPFCAQLDTERAKRRDTPVQRGSGDQFDECIDPTESTLILGSTDKAHFNRIGVLIGPYEAGPYAEGDYDITLPVTDAVLALVKPEYRQYFAVKR